MTPEQEIARRKRLLRAARATLATEFGLTYGAGRIVRALNDLGISGQETFSAFTRFLAAIPLDIPLGPARLLWDTRAMLATDLVLAAVEELHRQPVFEECARIIALYDDSK